MNTANVHLIFLVNHTKSRRTSFIKQKYLTEVTNCYWQFFAKPLERGLEKPRMEMYGAFVNTSVSATQQLASIILDMFNGLFEFIAIVLN